MSKKRYSIYVQRSLALKFESVAGRRKGGKSALVRRRAAGDARAAANARGQ